MSSIASIPRWIRIAGTAALALGVGVMLLFPCGCVGVTFWRPPTLPVASLPVSCSILSAPSPWHDGAAKFDTGWRNLPPGVIPFDMIVFYEVKVEATGSLQVSLSVPAENTLKRSSDRYRVQGQRLVPVSSEVSATLLPVVPGGPYGNGQFAYGRENYARKPSVEGFDTGTPQWAAMHSYSGQGLPTPGTFVFALDDLVPWVIQRTGYIEFVDRPRSVFLSPVVYKFCGEEWWMRAVSGLHGRVVFTMPLEPDGRTFIFCDLRPKK